MIKNHMILQPVEILFTLSFRCSPSRTLPPAEFAFNDLVPVQIFSPFLSKKVLILTIKVLRHA
jgi:hypothetical protein